MTNGTEIERLKARVQELEKQKSDTRREALNAAASEARFYGQRVPMARMHADRIAEIIDGLKLSSPAQLNTKKAQG
jgi:hypothetical protein